METTDNTRFVRPLIEHFGTTPLASIDQGAALQAAQKLYPGVKASTLNRQLFTPLLAILNMAARQGKCPPPAIERPKGHNESPPLDIPAEEWFAAVMPHCRPQLAALMAFLTLAGRRIGEGMSIKPTDIDLNRAEVSIPTTKSKIPIVVPIPGAVMDWLKMDEGWRGRERVFGYGNRSNVYRDARKACKKAGVRYYSPHAFGRHAFATRLLRAGLSLVFVKDAGHWKTIKMVADRYGHLERREVDDAVRKIGESWGTSGAKSTVGKSTC